MQMIEIVALENGAHRNQTYHGTLPDGWAVIPVDMEIPETFPFVDVTAEEIDEVMTVTSMTPGIVPEPAPAPEPTPSMAERVATLEEALSMILEGVTE